MDFKHGYLFTGDKKTALNKAIAAASEILGKTRDSINSDPDFFLLETATLSIDHSRLLRTWSSQKSFSGKGRVFVVMADFFTKESSDALLKTFEEPAADSRFFLITGSKENIPGTLRSRLFPEDFEIPASSLAENKEFILEFLNSTIDKRLEILKPFISDKQKAVSFLGGIVEVLNGDFLKGAVINAEIAEETAKCREMLLSPGAYPKMVLEHLAYFLPKTK
ncbi:MAG: hypothetical protein PHC85_00815 [Candidatus Pacebacteria bacterium]|nr:hypothetical protein [Candidatus Paceibacterota bacterium]